MMHVRVIRSDKKPIFNVATRRGGAYKVSGFADGTPVEKVVDISGPRVDVHLC